MRRDGPGSEAFQLTRPQELFARHCQGCHLADGGEVGQNRVEVPAIRDTLALILQDREGREFLIRIPGVAMAPVGDGDLTRLMNWLIERYARNAGARFTEVEVRNWRRKPLDDVVRARRRITDRIADTASGPREAPPAIETRPKPIELRVQ